MYERGMIILGLSLFLALVTCPFWLRFATGGGTQAPELLLPSGETSCVESVEYMRRSHMELLDVWRDEVVRNDRREYTAADGTVYEMSLTRTCLGCHSNKSAFCDRCHGFVAVAPDCWECHVAPPEESHGR